MRKQNNTIKLDKNNQDFKGLNYMPISLKFTTLLKRNLMKQIPLWGLLFVMFSCDNRYELGTVVVGSESKNYQIVKLDPNMKLKGPASDSLDVDADGNFDIKFLVANVPTTSGFATVKLCYTQNGLQVALSSINNHPDTLQVNTVLNNNTNWSNPKTTEHALLSYIRSDMHGHYDQIGNFGEVASCFLGFKKDGKEGWIQIENTYDVLTIVAYTQLK